MTGPAAESHEREAAEAVRHQLGARQPSVAIVLGSGFSAFAARLREAIRMPYADVPHFPLPTVTGHEGALIAGRVGRAMVLVQSGRLHMYEGHSAQISALPVRVFARLGIGTVLFTNAAGGVRPTLRPGTLMLIADHINLTFRNPLVGPAHPGDARFPDMSDPYDATLRARARDVARRRGIPLDEGVYAALLGPSYETPAEVRMLERLGADAVGMSTVVEVIAARAQGLRCLGVSTIANFACGMTTAPLTHAEVLAVTASVSGRLGDLIEGIVDAL